MERAKNRPLPVLTDADVERFWSFVAKASPDECWVWKGGALPAGYGHFWAGGRTLKAVRVSWFIATGEDPGERCVLHHCDNPRCVNHRHHFLGTLSDNMKDMVRKGRNHDFGGERHPQFKLTDATIADIRHLYAANKLDQYELAEKFNVSQSYISQLVRQERRPAA